MQSEPGNDAADVGVLTSGRCVVMLIGVCVVVPRGVDIILSGTHRVKRAS